MGVALGMASTAFLVAVQEQRVRQINAGPKDLSFFIVLILVMQF
jgi:hypothetical protein